MKLFSDLLAYPYLRWHIVFIILPSVILWAREWKYLIRYKKTILYATIIALVYGIPADLLASTHLKLWYSLPSHTLGGFYLGLPPGEYIFILLAPQLTVSCLLLMRRKLYAR